MVYGIGEENFVIRTNSFATSKLVVDNCLLDMSRVESVA